MATYLVTARSPAGSTVTLQACHSTFDGFLELGAPVVCRGRIASDPADIATVELEISQSGTVASTAQARVLVEPGG